MTIFQAGTRLCLILAAAAFMSADAASLAVSPGTAQVRAGGTVTFAGSWSGAPPTSLTRPAASASVRPSGAAGAIIYTAQAAPPVPNTVAIPAAGATSGRLNSDPPLRDPSPRAAGSNDPQAVGSPRPGGLVLREATQAATVPVQVAVTPATGTVRCGASLRLTARVVNTTDQAVAWQVNGIAGGSASVGTITTAGVYTAPAALPASATAAVTVTVTAVSHADPAATATATVNLQNPQPVATSVSPNPLNAGTATLTVTGSGFASGATVYFAGAPLATTFVSSTRLTATGSLAMPAGRMAAVKVVNPDPGKLTSAPVAVPVRPAGEQMPYADAVRFLKMATWGPTPASVVELQTMGRDAWLAAQFAKPASAWPDPLDPTEGVSRLQTSFFDIALNGDDQLRQRVAFALAQILVVSAVKDTHFDQMVGYQRLMGASAFGKFRDLLESVTLNPSMGYFLDMASNAQANPTKGTVANENYAREIMQLFTVGLTQLSPDGLALLAGGGAAPEYDQSTVAQMAKVMTGWTYAPAPGYAGGWASPAYYFQPMVPYDSYHDQTQKVLNLPIPCTISAGGTARGDLQQALDCLCAQTNVAPFISYRLIQRLVMSEPSAAYVSRVASVFKFSGGDLKAVVTAILTDSEAATEGAGKLDEPALYATGLLRELNASDTSAAGLAAQTAAMGQNVLAPGSVFSYFTPYFTIPGTTPAVVAPEFQVVNAATALARANFAYKAVTNGISSGIQVNLSNLQDLAANPANLVEAVNQALYHGQMDDAVRSILTTAANGSTNALTRVRSVLYAAAAAPEYEVQR